MKMRWPLLVGCLAGVFQASAGVVTYPAPEGEELSVDYEVQAGGKTVPVYRARVLDPPFADKGYDFGGPYSFAAFDVSGPVEVRVHCKRPLDKVEIRPTNPDVRTRIENADTLLVSLPGPRKLSIEPEGKKGPLLLFANPLENAPPSTDEPGANLIYFGPGVHTPGRIVVTNNQTLYIAGGAIVKGGILAEGENIRILGRGILDGSDWEWRKGPTPHVISIRGTNVEVSGLIIRGASHWTIVPRNSRNVVVRNVKLCGSRVQNDDGINPCNSQDVLITDCFIRSDDDCVALKGLDLNAINNNVERIIVKDCIFWCDRARIFLLGHESRAAYMRDIQIRNLDIIHYSMTPFLLEPGEEMRLQNVLVENVRVHGEGQNELIRLKPVVNQYMRNKVPGHISDVHFREVKVAGKPGPYRVQLSGADEQHNVRNVTFENVEIAGEKLSGGSERLEVGPQVSSVRFANQVPLLLRTQSVEGEFPGWKSFHEEAGVTTGDVWRVQEDGIVVCKGRPRGYLYTDQEFTDCVVRFAWRYPTGATGSKGGALVRMTGEHIVWPKCLEFQLNLGQAGDFWAIRDFLVGDSTPRLEIITNSPQGTLRHVPREVDAERPAGQWNVFEGIMIGGSAVQRIDGRTVSVAEGCTVVPGKILLTAEGNEIHFRNVQIVPLTDR